MIRKPIFSLLLLISMAFSIFSCTESKEEHSPIAHADKLVAAKDTTGEALNIYMRYDSIFEQENNIRGRVEMNYKIGGIYSNNNKTNDAMKYYKAGMHLADKHLEKKDNFYKKNAVRCAYIYANSHNMDSCVVYFKKALLSTETYLSGIELDLEQTQILSDIAFTYKYFKQDKLGVEYMDQALSKLNAHISNRSERIDEALNSIGRYYFSSHNYSEAEKTYLKVINRNFNLDNPNIANETYYNIGNALRKMGDLYRAEKYLNKSLELGIERDPNNLSMGVMMNYYKLAELYYSTDNVEKSLDYFHAAIKVGQGISGNNIAYYESAILNDWGEVLLNEEKPKEALEKFKKAEQIIGDAEKSDLVKGLIMKNIARVQYLLGDYGKFKSNLAKSLTLLEKVFEEEHQQKTFAHLLLSKYHVEKKEWTVASEENNMALENAILIQQDNLLIPNYEAAINSLIDRIELIEASQKHSNYSKYPQTSEMLTLLERNIAQMQSTPTVETTDLAAKEIVELSFMVDYLITELRHQSVNSDSKFLTSKRYHDFYEKTLSIIYNSKEQGLLDNAEELALYFLEKSKAVVLKEKLGFNASYKNVTIPDELRKKEADLKYLISAKKEELNKAKSSDSNTALKNELFKLQLQQDLVIKEISNLVEVQQPNNKLTISALQAHALNTNSIFISYYLGSNQSFALCISSTGASLEILETENIKELTQELITFLSTNPYTEKTRISKFYNLSSQLFNNLIAPANISMNNKLVIIPDGILHYLPFEVLLKQASPTSLSYQTLAYLIKEHTIHYDFSLENVLQNEVARSTATEDFAGFAPSFNNNLLAAAEVRGCSNVLVNLKETSKSVKSISPLFNGAEFIEENATLEIFIQNIKKYKLLLLATHACVDDEDPMFSKIYFTQTLDGNNYLSAHALYNMQLDADLVYLSACETALGEILEGEGVQSLSRAFLLGGAKSIVTTLWEVNDKSASQITISFFSNFKNGFDKSTSLQKAKLKLIKHEKLSHPYFWSPFILIGNNTTFSAN